MFFEAFMTQFIVPEKYTEKPEHNARSFSGNFCDAYFGHFLQSEDLDNNRSAIINSYQIIVAREGNSIVNHMKTEKNTFNRLMAQFKEDFTSAFLEKSKEMLSKESLKRSYSTMSRTNLKEFEEYTEYTQQAIENIQEFLRIIIKGICLFYNEVYSSDTLNAIKEFILTHIAETVIEGGVYETLYNLLRAETYNDECKLREQMQGYGCVNPQDLGVKSYLCLNSQSGIKEILQECSVKLNAGETFIIEENVEGENNYRSQTFMSNALSYQNENVEVELEGNEFSMATITSDEDAVKPDSHNFASEGFNSMEGNPNANTRQYAINMSIMGSNQISPQYPSFPNSYEVKKRLTRKPYLRVIKRLQQLQTLESPMEKLDVISHINESICAAVDEFWRGIPIEKDKLFIDADQLLSLYIYVIIESRMSDLWVHLALVNQFTPYIAKTHNAGYNLTSLEACLIHIMDMRRDTMTSAGNAVHSTMPRHTVSISSRSQVLNKPKTNTDSMITTLGMRNAVNYSFA